MRKQKQQEAGLGPAQQMQMLMQMLEMFGPKAQGQQELQQLMLQRTQQDMDLQDQMSPLNMQLLEAQIANQGQAQTAYTDSRRDAEYSQQLAKQEELRKQAIFQQELQKSRWDMQQSQQSAPMMQDLLRAQLEGAQQQNRFAGAGPLAQLSGGIPQYMQQLAPSFLPNVPFPQMGQPGAASPQDPQQAAILAAFEQMAKAGQQQR